ncbi:MAG: outer-membrane lipoprotein carrier protein LolA [Elusimicrobia bacterium]|nr:outer-membrane lipoprotein carrier protein LolA [Elusimicrobiota bacterium]
MNKSINSFLKYLSLILTPVFLFAYSSVAQDLNIKEVMQKMETADDALHSLRFNFKQKIVFLLTNESQTKNGEAVFSKPDKIRIRQISPEEQVITGNGKKVWIYTPLYKQVAVDKWKKWLKNDNLAYTFFGYLKSFKEFEQQYFFELQGKELNKIIIFLSPKKDNLPKMKFWIDDETFMPVRSVIYLGNVEIQTDMEKIEKNPTLAKDEFKFKVPPKTNIIEFD